MKQFLLSAAISLITFIGFGQCPPELIIFDTQEKIDDFATIYPNCTDLPFSLKIRDIDVSDISIFSQLVEVDGDIEIAGTNLQNLSGLENLVSLDNDLFILENPFLENVEALSNLEPFISNTSFVVVDGNDQLTSLEGLQNLDNVYYLYIGNNSNLVDIEAIKDYNLNTFANTVTIHNNSSLSECSVTSVCETLNNQNITLEIENNAMGCDSITQVEFQCTIISIPDNNFLNALLNHTPIIDTNSDGNIQFDEAEAFTGTLNVANKVISDFTGLEAFINITGFDGSNNFMSELSLEANTALTSVDFSVCPDVEKVFLKNGNNTAITSFEGLNCPSLQFVCVDDVAFAKANFTNIDPQVTFVDDCEVLAVSDFNLAETVSVFPNPVSENLTILTNPNINFIKAKVYSISGQKLMETNTKSIDFSILQEGVYFARINSKEGTTVKKIIKK